jgi:hypothetical protein
MWKKLGFHDGGGFLALVRSLGILSEEQQARDMRLENYKKFPLEDKGGDFVEQRAA